MAEPILRDIRTRRFWKSLITRSFALFGAFAAIGGVIALFNADFFTKNAWLGFAGVGAALIYGAVASWPRPVVTRYTTPATKISLLSGDLFEQHGAHLVVGASDTFDTAAPYIEPSSVQGQFLGRIYGGDVAKLDADIDAELAPVVSTEFIAGKSGKTARYRLGTTVTLRENARRFFLVAYTLMDSKSSASSTTDGVWNSLSELWKAVRVGSNGGTVCIPMIGGGQSKLSAVLPAADSVRFIALSFMLASRTQKVCSELVIVARPSEYNTLDHLELQAFLNSLRPS